MISSKVSTTTDLEENTIEEETKEEDSRPPRTHLSKTNSSQDTPKPHHIQSKDMKICAICHKPIKDLHPIKCDNGHLYDTKCTTTWRIQQQLNFQEYNSTQFKPTPCPLCRITLFDSKEDQIIEVILGPLNNIQKNRLQKLELYITSFQSQYSDLNKKSCDKVLKLLNEKITLISSSFSKISKALEETNVDDKKKITVVISDELLWHLKSSLELINKVNNKTENCVFEKLILAKTLLNQFYKLKTQNETTNAHLTRPTKGLISDLNTLIKINIQLLKSLQQQLQSQPLSSEIIPLIAIIKSLTNITKTIASLSFSTTAFVIHSPKELTVHNSH